MAPQKSLRFSGDILQWHKFLNHNVFRFIGSMEMPPVIKIGSSRYILIRMILIVVSWDLKYGIRDEGI